MGVFLQEVPVESGIITSVQFLVAQFRAQSKVFVHGNVCVQLDLSITGFSGSCLRKLDQESPETLALPFGRGCDVLQEHMSGFWLEYEHAAGSEPIISTQTWPSAICEE